MLYHNEEITREIIAAAIEVHKHLGPGLLEIAYQVCLAEELSLFGQGPVLTLFKIFPPCLSHSNYIFSVLILKRSFMTACGGAKWQCTGRSLR
jgi:hypothetical protein